MHAETEKYSSRFGLWPGPPPKELTPRLRTSTQPGYVINLAGPTQMGGAFITRQRTFNIVLDVLSVCNAFTLHAFTPLPYDLPHATSLPPCKTVTKF